MSTILDRISFTTAASLVLLELSEEAHKNAKAHGFYGDYKKVRGTLMKSSDDKLANIQNCEALKRDFTLAQFAKIASEIGEAVHAIQHNKEEELPEEIADIIIRCFDLCGFLELDIGRSVIEKMKANRERPYLHGKTC